MKHIAISGTVAAGKSTLIHRLLETLGDRAAAHEERPDHNPFISVYYADSKRWSFHSQVTFLTLYFEDPAWRGDATEFFFYDRCLIENLVLAQYRRANGDLTADELSVIEQLARGLESLMPPIDGYLYLKCSEERLIERLRERNRDYEQQLDMSYVSQLKALYDAWAASLPPEKVLIVDEDAGVDLDAVLAFIGAAGTENSTNEN